MRHLHWTLLTVSLLHMAFWAQANPHQVLRDALNLENQGNFEPAAKTGKLAIDSRQLAGAELGRAYIFLGVASGSTLLLSRYRDLRALEFVMPCSALSSAEATTEDGSRTIRAWVEI